MSFMRSDDVTIPIFDGEDYSNWKKRILKFLQFKKCATVATRSKTESDKDEDWTTMDVKATNYIDSAISNKQLEFIGDLESAYLIMRKFDEMYSKESTALQIVCRNRLENIRLNQFSDTASFFNEFEKAVNELKAAGAKITEQEKLNYMLRTLPESYSHVGDLIDVLKEEEKTVEYVKTKISLKENLKKNLSDESKGANAFVTETRGTC